ncbi:MAG TPA: lysophospholipid acyltransferase family protein [Puia sp.]|nr:lysophospholipid acyltransferase family protein [Puia sp.]
MNYTGSDINSKESSGHEREEMQAQKGSLLMEIFGRICALWALILFVVTMLLFLIPFLLFSYFAPDPTKTRRFVRYSRVWMGIFLTGIGCPLRIKGKEKFKKGETYIVLCNHNSLMDVPISTPGIPGANKTIAKTSFAKVPLFGLFYRTGSVLVDRNSEASRRESFSKMKEVLEMGMHMCLYPEGTRNKTNNPLKSFHDGAFRLSLTSGKAIIPAVIFNSRWVLPADKPFFVRPRRLRMHYLDPIVPEPGENVEGLKQRVFQIMWDYYVANKD